MEFFSTEKVTDRITRIKAPAEELMYLVEGDERAALLDTGTGVGNLRPLIEKLTDKPVIVLITHGHLDHAMGAAEFDEAYMNLVDEYIYTPHSDKVIRLNFVPEKVRKSMNLTEDDCIDPVPVSFFHDLKPGDCFDLGGETIEIYGCSGHTQGSVVMLLKEERILLLGDACNKFTFLFDDYSTTVETYEENLKVLEKEVEGKYDRILLSHADGEGNAKMISQVIQVCEDIKNGDVDDISFSFGNRQAYIAKKRSDNGNIVYSKERIWNK